MFCPNIVYHRVIGISPIQCLFGFIPKIPSYLKRKTSYNYSKEKAVFHLRNKLQKGYEIPRKTSN